MAQYQWKAVYNDGRELCQYNGDGSENKYTDIERVILVRFALLQVNTGLPVLTIHFDRPGQRLVYRRRVAKHFCGVTGDSKSQDVYLLAGWQETVNGHNFQSISVLFEDGHVETRPGFVDISPFGKTGKPLPGE